MVGAVIVVNYLPFIFASGDAQTPTERLRSPIQNYLELGGADANERRAYKPQLSDVIVLQLDVNGDGRKWTFVSSTGVDNRSGNIWQVYERLDSSYRHVDDGGIDIQFRPNLYHLGFVPELNFTGLLTYYRDSASTGALYGYVFSEGRARQQHLRDIDLDKDSDNALVHKYLPLIDTSKGPGRLEIFPIDQLRSEGFKLPDE
jgi:hypothetical protein